MRLLVSLILFFAFSPFANATGFLLPDHVQQSILNEVDAAQLPWKAGEYAEYDLSMGFFNGTMVIKVREETDRGFWLEQITSVMGQKQVAEILFDKNTGEILEFIVDGRKQEPPKRGEQPEVIEVSETEITVPAGTFECVYAKLRDKETQKDTEIWMNDAIAPVAGMLQQKAPSQFGTVTLSLTKANKL